MEFIYPYVLARCGCGYIPDGTIEVGGGLDRQSDYVLIT